MACDNPCACNDTCQRDHTVASDVIKSLITRVLFFIQCFVSIWRVVDVKQAHGQDNYNMYWLMCVLMLGLLLDTFYTIGHRKGKEYKWVSTSFFFFLVAAIPPIWVLELDRWDRYQTASSMINTTITQNVEALSSFVGIKIPLYLAPDTWVQLLEQSLILLLIPTRWILPRGSMSRERLSQVLLVYLALGADIIELFDLFELDNVMQDFYIYIAILGVWSLSLLQFSLLLASTGKSRKNRFAFVSPYSEPRRKSSKKGDEHTFDPVEVAALCMTMFLQDIPFLCVRLYIIIRYKLITNTLFFFATKNLYVIVLQLYRISVITLVIPSAKKHRKESSEGAVAVQLDDIDVDEDIDDEIDGKHEQPKPSGDNETQEGQESTETVPARETGATMDQDEGRGVADERERDDGLSAAGSQYL